MEVLTRLLTNFNCNSNGENNFMKTERKWRGNGGKYRASTLKKASLLRFFSVSRSINTTHTSKCKASERISGPVLARFLAILRAGDNMNSCRCLLSHQQTEGQGKERNPEEPVNWTWPASFLLAFLRCQLLEFYPFAKCSAECSPKSREIEWRGKFVYK